MFSPSPTSAAGCLSPFRPSRSFHLGEGCECSCVDAEYECGFNGYTCLDPANGGIYSCEAQLDFPPCSVDAPPTWVVEDHVQARAMAANISCSGGSFEVYWRGHIALDDPIYVVNGTVLTVIGDTADASGAVLDGNDTTRLFTVDNATLHVSNVTIVSGASTIGGAVAAAGATLTFNSTTFFNNKADADGGALWLSDSTASFNGDTDFTFNYADTGGGGAMLIQDGSAVSWTGDTKFAFNLAGVDGGAVGSVALSESSSRTSTLLINGPTSFSNNTAVAHGGALALLGGLSLGTDGGNGSLVESARFIGNFAATAGGAVYVSQTAVGPTFSNVTFISNSAAVGGAVSVVGSGYAKEVDTDELQETTFDRCLFVGNYAETRGGAVASAGGGDRFLESVFTGNTAGTGGALRLSGFAYVEGCFFEDNVSDEGEGAAISNAGTISRMLSTNFSYNVFDCQPDMFLNYSVRGALFGLPLAVSS